MLRYLPWLAALALVIGTAALELAQLHAALGAAHPAGDHAIFELNVRRASSADQWLGPYSQGFYHPGPAYFYWLLPAYAALGQSSFALYAGAQALTLLFLFGSCAAVARYGSSFSALLALVPLLAIEMAYLGDFPRFDYWPPYVLFLGFALFLLLAAGVFAGERSAIAPLAVLGSFLVQTHVSYLPAVVVLSAVSLARAARTRPGFLWNAARRQILLALLLLVVMWALPIRAEFSEHPSNFARLYRTFVAASPDAPSLGSVIDKLALEFSAPWQFVLFRDRFIFPDAPKHQAAARVMAVIQLGLLALAWRKSRARGERFTEALCIVCGVSLLTAAFALTRTRGALAPHHSAWISIIGFVVWLAIIAGCWASATPRWASRTVHRFLILAGAWFVSCLIWPIRIISAVHANPEIAELTESVTRVIRETSPGRVKISWEPPLGAQAPADALTWATSVMLELEKSKHPFFTGKNPDLRWMLGRPRWEAKDAAGAELVFFVGEPSPFVERIQCVERGDNYFLRYPACVGRLTRR